MRSVTEQRKLRDDIKVFCTYIFFILMTFSKSMGMSSQDKAYYCIAGISTLVWCVGVLCMQYKTRDLIVIAILMAIALISLYITHSPVIVMLAMSLIILKDMNIGNVIKAMGITWMAVIIAAMIGTVAGIIPFRTYPDEKIYIWIYPGHNPFHEAVALFFIYYYIVRNKATILSAVVFTIVNIVIFNLTTSSGGFIIGMAIILGYTLWHYTNKREGLWKILSICMLIANVALVIFSFIIGSMYHKGNVWSERWDHIFTNRVHVMRDMLDAYDILPFGNRLNGRIDYELMDNAFLDLLVEYGFVIFLAVMVMYGLVIRGFFIRKRYREIMNCSIMLAYGIVEQMMRNCFLNFTLLYFAWVIWDNWSEDTRTEEKAFEEDTSYI